MILQIYSPARPSPPPPQQPEQIQPTPFETPRQEQQQPPPQQQCPHLRMNIEYFGTDNSMYHAPFTQAQIDQYALDGTLPPRPAISNTPPPKRRYNRWYKKDYSDDEESLELVCFPRGLH